MEIKTNKKIILLILVFILIDFLAGYLLLFPLFKKIRNNSIENDLARIKTEEIKNKIILLEQDERLYDSQQGSLEKINKTFLSSAVPVEFISFLENLSQKNGLSIEIFPLSEAPAKKEKEKKEVVWPGLSFGIEVKGGAEGLLLFLNEIENSPYLIEIKELKIEKMEKTNNNQTETDIDTMVETINLRVLTGK